MREIPIDNLEGLKVPDAVLLCRRGDSWVAEKDGSRAGDFVLSLVGDSERLYPEPNGSSFSQMMEQHSVCSNLCYPEQPVLHHGKVRELRNIPSEKSYEMLLGKAVESHKLLNLARLAAAVPKAAAAVPTRTDRHIVLAHGPARMEELADDIGVSWAREAVSRIADPSHFPDVEIPSGLTDEILDSARTAAGENRGAYEDFCADLGFACDVIRSAFSRDLESEAEFYDSSATDNVRVLLDCIDTSKCIVILKDSASGFCEYLFSDTESFIRHSRAASASSRPNSPLGDIDSMTMRGISSLS